jgi:hypothetical protein
MISMQRIILFLFTFGSFVTAAQAQTVASTHPTAALVAAADNTIPANTDKGWVFFVNPTQNTCYIDFEQIHANLKDIVVKNIKGEIIFREEVLDLPVNTMYELDLSLFDKGEYVIEVHSLTGIIKQKVKA